MKTRFRRIIAAFLLVNILQSVLLPSIASALTSGPSAPQTSSYEPFDMSEMVNLVTGDFTYNIPLLEVPGNDLNFPVNLFYHAGIETNLEASNYGLGWGLNAGSIDRNVNGHPDDYAVENYLDANCSNCGEYTPVGQQLFNSGNTNNGSEWSLGIPGTPLSLSYVSMNSTQNGKFKKFDIHALGMSMSELAGGRKYWKERDYVQSLGIELGKAAIMNVMYSAASPTGISISPTQSQTGNLLSLYTANTHESIIPTDNDWTFEDNSYSRGGFGIMYTKIKQRSFLDVSYFPLPYGALHLGNFFKFSQEEWKFYSTMDIVPDITAWHKMDNRGAINIAFDDYSVNAPSISGSVVPKVFDNGSVMGMTTANKSAYTSLKNFSGYDTEKVQFRYGNEFASKYEMANGTISYTSPNWQGSGTGFLTDPVDDTNIGFKNRHLKGSKYVEWYSENDLPQRKDIMGTAPGGSFSSQMKNVIFHRPFEFKPQVLEIGSRPGSPASSKDQVRVKAFKINALDGLEYHFGLPVFNNKTQNVTFPSKILSGGSWVDQNTPTNSYILNKSTAPFAYTWLMTAITSPDYVDRQTDPYDQGYNFTDENDWGNYVKFTYGNHTQNDRYSYRGPYQGYDFDLVYENRSASAGDKELFYMNSIQTKTHTAVFFHSTRDDGKGATIDVMGNAVGTPSKTQLRTDEIRLFKNEDLKALINSYGLVNKGVVGTPRETDQVYLTSDMGALNSTLNNEIKARSIRTIKFIYDYSLCKNTLNSTAVGGGKLTLKEIEVRGRNDVKAMPNYVFDYNQTSSLRNPDYNRHAWDRWGYYKIDVSMQNSYPQDRITTCTSKDYVDAWSLRKITTPLGADLEIDYESDDYSKIGNGALITTVSTMMKDEGHFTGGNYNASNAPNSLTIAGVTGQNYLDAFQEYLQNGKRVGLNFEYEENNVTHTFCATALVSAVSSNGCTFNNFSAQGEPHSNVGVFMKNIVLNTKYNPLILDNPGTGCANPNPNIKYGGGIRVKEIRLNNIGGDVLKTKYGYTKLNSLGETISTGVTALEPLSWKRGSGAFQADIVNDPLQNTFGAVAPGVLYSKVTVESFNGSLPTDGKIVYDHEVFNGSEHFSVNVVETPGSPNIYKVNIVDNTSRLGRPLAVTSYNRLGHEETKVEYEYYTTDAPNSQGKLKEVSHSIADQYGFVSRGFCNLLNYGEGTQPGNLGTLASIKERTTYPSVLKSIKVRSKNGVENLTENLSFDFYTGQVLTSKTKSPNNKTIKTTITPAYLKYTEMGSKVDNASYKNMLSQTAEVKTELLDNAGSGLGILSNDITTWNDDWSYRELQTSTNKYVDVTYNNSNLWRKHKSFTWKSDLNARGTFSTTPATFDWSTPTATQNANWVKTGEIIKYDQRSNAIEEKDINNNYASAKLGGYNSNLVLATAANSRYTEFYYSGAEDLNTQTGWFGGEMRPFNGTVVSTYAHTGTKCLQVSAGGSPNGFVIRNAVGIDVFKGKTYQVGVWVKDDGSLAGKRIYAHYVDANGTNVPSVDPPDLAANNYALKAGGWVLVNHTVTIPNSTSVDNLILVVGVQTTSGIGYYDDFRFRPLDAPMSSYVYDPQTNQVTYILDNDHLFTQYQYDAAGRLIGVYREAPDNPTNITGKRKVSQQIYHFKRPF